MVDFDFRMLTSNRGGFLCRGNDIVLQTRLVADHDNAPRLQQESSTPVLEKCLVKASLEQVEIFTSISSYLWE